MEEFITTFNNKTHKQLLSRELLQIEETVNNYRKSMGFQLEDEQQIKKFLHKSSLKTIIDKYITNQEKNISTYIPLYELSESQLSSAFQFQQGKNKITQRELILINTPFPDFEKWKLIKEEQQKSDEYYGGTGPLILDVTIEEYDWEKEEQEKREKREKLERDEQKRRENDKLELEKRKIIDKKKSYMDHQVDFINYLLLLFKNFPSIDPPVYKQILLQEFKPLFTHLKQEKQLILTEYYYHNQKQLTNNIINKVYGEEIRILEDVKKRWQVPKHYKGIIKDIVKIFIQEIKNKETELYIKFEQ
jgi:hypothetical protein